MKCKLLLKQAFTATYRDPKCVVQDFVDYILKCSAAFQEANSEYMAPYIALVQSSGFGKSRLLRQTARSLRVMYVCLRTSGNGYPLRTNRAIAALFDRLPVTGIEMYVTELVDRLELCLKSALCNLPKPGQDDRDDESLFPSERLADTVWNFNSAFYTDLEGETVVLVFDEARALLETELFEAVSQFRLVRRAIADYCETRGKNKLFVVFEDTCQRIQNFAPSLSRDQSLRQRVLEEKAGNLFHPYILRST